MESHVNDFDFLISCVSIEILQRNLWSILEMERLNCLLKFAQ